MWGYLLWVDPQTREGVLLNPDTEEVRRFNYERATMEDVQVAICEDVIAQLSAPVPVGPPDLQDGRRPVERFDVERGERKRGVQFVTDTRALVGRR